MAGRGGGELTSRCLPVLLGLLALAACAETGGTGACQIAPVATLTLSPERHVVVDGRLNRQPARFLLDTGAERSVVASWAMDPYRVERLRGETGVYGTGGLMMTSVARAQLDLGGDEVWRSMPVADLPGGSRPGPAYAALLGADVLAAYDLEISFPENRVRLWQTANCRGAYALWGGTYGTVPLEVRRSGHLRMSLSIDGKPVTALLDTGASGSILTEDAAERIGVTPSMLAADPAGTNRGITGKIMADRMHRFGTVQIGPETMAATMRVSAIRLSQADMLLGADWMRSRRVWISWANKKVFVQHASAARAPEAGSAAASVP